MSGRCLLAAIAGLHAEGKTLCPGDMDLEKTLNRIEAETRRRPKIHTGLSLAAFVAALLCEDWACGTPNKMRISRNFRSDASFCLPLDAAIDLDSQEAGHGFTQIAIVEEFDNLIAVAVHA